MSRPQSSTSALPSSSSSGPNAASSSSSREASREEMAGIRRLVQCVTRQFYEDHHVIIIDQLSRYQVLPADALAACLGMTTKDVARETLKLIEDRIISLHRRDEAKEGVSNRTFKRSYYFLDYKSVLDVIKWRLMKMRSNIDSVLRNELDNKGFVCPRCRRAFSTLDVSHLLSPSGEAFICDTPGCRAELVDNEDADDVRRSKDRLRRFNEQCGGIIDGVRRVEGLALPPVDINQWIAVHGSKWKQRDKGQTPASLLPTADVAFAKSSSNVSGPGLQVDLTSADPAAEAARRKREDEEAERKREQNQLPEWLKKSTVSGEDTGLAAREGGRRESWRADAKDEQALEDDDDDYYAEYARMQAEEQGAGNGAAAKRARSADDDDDEERGSPNGGAQSKKAKLQAAATKEEEDGDEEEEEPEMEDFEEI